VLNAALRAARKLVIMLLADIHVVIHARVFRLLTVFDVGNVFHALEFRVINVTTISTARTLIVQQLRVLTLLPLLAVHVPLLLTLDLSAHFSEAEHGVIFYQAAILLLYHRVRIRIVSSSVGMIVRDTLKPIAHLIIDTALH
jgi:hypothetical protein